MLTVNRDGEVIEEEEAEQYVEASTDAERIISNIWSEVLGAGKIGMNDNFFELGGHSLKATQVVSRIKKNTGSNLPSMTYSIIRPLERWLSLWKREFARLRIPREKVTFQNYLMKRRNRAYRFRMPSKDYGS
ncbi:phosphopantetheine-binding protein [Paenibacillus rhizoplanae]